MSPLDYFATVFVGTRHLVKRTRFQVGLFNKKKHNREFHLKLIDLQKSTLPWLGVLTTVSPCLLFTMSVLELYFEKGS